MSRRHWIRRVAPRLTAVGALLFAATLLASCDGIADNDLAAPDRVSLEAATILTEHTDAGTATLEDGEFREPVAPGSASDLVIRLSQSAVGDLDGNGIPDAAAITVENAGGSGNFRYLHALLKEEGELHDADAVFLGDRIRVLGLSIHDGVIAVALLDRPPDAPFAEAPSIPVIRRFRLAGETLEEIESASRDGAFACDDSLPDAALVVVTSPAGGEEVASGFAVSRLLAHLRVERTVAAARSRGRRAGERPRDGRRSGRPRTVRLHRRVRIRRPATRAPRGVRGGRVRRRGVPAAARRRAAGDRPREVSCSAARMPAQRGRRVHSLP